MIKKEIITKKVEEITDIICDNCNQSCKIQTVLNKDIKYLQLEYATIFANFGYGSDRDGEVHVMHLCSLCYENLIFKKFKGRIKVDKIVF